MALRMFKDGYIHSYIAPKSFCFPPKADTTRSIKMTDQFYFWVNTSFEEHSGHSKKLRFEMS